jgi:multiple sugar transport system permease protein
LKKKKDTMQFFLFISPWIAGFLFLIFIPTVMSLYYSFTDWDVLTPAKFIGINNYIGLFQDDLFFQSVKVTGVYTLLAVPMNVFLTLLVAMLLNTEIKGISLFRTIFYMPAILSSVVISVLWQWILNSKYGILNAALGKLGIEGPRWLSDPKWAMTSLLMMALWGIGGGIIMYLAGLQAVPNDLYEAAHLDGAGFVNNLVHITLPSMSPIILFTFLTSMIGTLQTFTQAYIMTEGGPNNSTLFYAYYLYNNGFVYRKMGKACAMAWLLLLVIFSLSVLVLKVSSKFVYYESDEGGRLI